MERAKGLLSDGPVHFASLDGTSWLEVSREVELEDLPRIKDLFEPVQENGLTTFNITMDTRYLRQHCDRLVIEAVT